MVLANAMRLELELRVEAEVDRVEHDVMMAAAWNQPDYLGLAHPDPVSMERRRTARYLYADCVRPRRQAGGLETSAQ